MAVVDPGVGTDRRPLLLVTAEGRFVAPDNGLLSYVLMGHGVRTESGGAGDFLKPMEIPVPDGCRAYVLDRDKYWLKPISDTFHGRDVFCQSPGFYRPVVARVIEPPCGPLDGLLSPLGLRVNHLLSIEQRPVW